MERKNSAVHYNYTEVWPTYQPKWEGNVRLTYHPVREWAVFGEVHYTDQYFTMYSRDNRGGEYAYLSGKPVSSLTVTNGGVKWNPIPAWQIAVGCNDIFNRGPKQKIRSNTAFTIPGYINPEFPLQGRTYYATVRYEF
jgi:outer membrane receptor protein involved in Fe transport